MSIDLILSEMSVATDTVHLSRNSPLRFIREYLVRLADSINQPRIAYDRNDAEGATTVAALTRGQF